MEVEKTRRESQPRKEANHLVPLAASTEDTSGSNANSIQEVPTLIKPLWTDTEPMEAEASKVEVAEEAEEASKEEDTLAEEDSRPEDHLVKIIKITNNRTSVR